MKPAILFEAFYFCLRLCWLSWASRTTLLGTLPLAEGERVRSTLLTWGHPKSLRNLQKTMILNMNQDMLGDLQRHQGSSKMISDTARLHKTWFQYDDFLNHVKIKSKSSRYNTFRYWIQNLRWTQMESTSKIMMVNVENYASEWEKRGLRQRCSRTFWFHNCHPQRRVLRTTWYLMVPWESRDLTCGASVIQSWRPRLLHILLLFRCPRFPWSHYVQRAVNRPPGYRQGTRRATRIT